MTHERRKSKYLVKNQPHLHFNYRKSHMKSMGSSPKHSLIDISNIRAFVYNVVKLSLQAVTVRVNIACSRLTQG